MDIRKIKKLIDLVENSEVNELEIQEGEETVRICCNNYQHVAEPAITAQPMPAQQPTPSAHTNSAPSTESTNAPGEQPSSSQSHEVISPMVGTFYEAPSPDAEPFVRVGQQVNKGDVLCIVEAMKMFNQIEADQSGTVVACYINNGDPVEYGQILFAIE